MARHIAQNKQRQAYDSRIACRHTVHAVVKIGTIGDRHYYKHCDKYEKNPSGSIFVLAAKSHNLGIIQVVGLEEGNGGLGRLYRIGFVDHLSYLVIVLYLYILPDDGIGAQKERQPHDKSQTQLPDKLYLGIEPVLAFLEIFDIVVGKAQNAQPDGCDNHQDEIDVAQAAKQ